jgi:hypothetical protein
MLLFMRTCPLEQNYRATFASHGSRSDIIESFGFQRTFVAVQKLDPLGSSVRITALVDVSCREFLSLLYRTMIQGITDFYRHILPLSKQKSAWVGPDGLFSVSP